MTLKVLCLALAILTEVAFVPTTAGAAILVSPTNTDTLTLGALVAGPLTNSIFGGAPHLGELTTSVYYDSGSGVYTYLYRVNPEVKVYAWQGNQTPFPGLVGAGYSFSDAVARGGSGGIDPISGVLSPGDGDLDTVVDPVFDIIYMNGAGQSNNLLWIVSVDAMVGNFWGNENLGTMQFHIQSIYGPGQSLMLFSTEVVGTSGHGYSMSYVPAAVPEPTTLLLFGSGLAGFGLAGFRKRSR